MMLYEAVESFIAKSPRRNYRLGEVLKGINSANRLQVYRVLQAMADHSFIVINPTTKPRGSYATYCLKVCH